MLDDDVSMLKVVNEDERIVIFIWFNCAIDNILSLIEE